MSFTSSAAEVAALGSFSALTDDALLAAQRTVAAHARSVDAIASEVATEIARRSARELGHSGLAARRGFRSPAELISSVSGISKASATKLVSAEAAPEVARAGLDAVDAVNRGLGRPDAVITVGVLETHRSALLSSGHTPDELFREARAVRDSLDASAIERREKTQRQLRYWKHFRRADGMVAGSYLLAPEDGELLSSAFQTLMSPRRGGPRFVDESARARASRDTDDTRSDEQFAADGLVAMVEVAVTADAGTVFPSKRPAVRVIVREVDLTTRDGHGVLDDSRQPISIATVERIACTSGYLGLRFDGNGQVVDVGREQRLHTARQRVAIAARDGGCMAVGCDVPVSMTEVHHPDHWDRDRGSTSVENGISLCRFHHMSVHNNGWDISWAGGSYWMIPPPEIDPEQVPRRLESKNPLLRKARGTRRELARTG